MEMYGFGRSVTMNIPQKWRGRTIDQCFRLMCSALEQWRSEMGLESFVLLGHSLGCHVVSAYAMGYPQRVQHLILASPIGVGIPNRAHSSASHIDEMHSVGSCIGSECGGDLDIGWKQYFGDMLWDLGCTPQDLLRWLGPFGKLLTRRYSLILLTTVPTGPCVTHRLFRWRESSLRRCVAQPMPLSSMISQASTNPLTNTLPKNITATRTTDTHKSDIESGSISRYASYDEHSHRRCCTSEARVDVLKSAANLAYQHLARRPYGERCLRVFLHPTGEAKRPLITWLGSASVKRRMQSVASGSLLASYSHEDNSIDFSNTSSCREVVLPQYVSKMKTHTSNYGTVGPATVGPATVGDGRQGQRLPMDLLKSTSYNKQQLQPQPLQHAVSSATAPSHDDLRLFHTGTSAACSKSGGISDSSESGTTSPKVVRVSSHEELTRVSLIYGSTGIDIAVKTRGRCANTSYLGGDGFGGPGSTANGGPSSGRPASGCKRSYGIKDDGSDLVVALQLEGIHAARYEVSKV